MKTTGPSNGHAADRKAANPTSAVTRPRYIGLRVHLKIPVVTSDVVFSGRMGSNVVLAARSVAARVKVIAAPATAPPSAVA